MINCFKPGDKKIFRHRVELSDIAQFKSGAVHEVYATFALARDAEWAGRLFVLEMKEEGEEGIGTFIEVEHASPAIVGQEVVFTATLDEVKGNSVICSFEASVGDRLIAKGRTGQKILPKDKIDRIFAAL